MDVQTEQMWFVRSVFDDLPEWMNGSDAFRLALRASGERLKLHQGDQYIWDYARRQGWYIPSYPMDPSGEVREFLADQGARDVAQWYRKVGVGADLYPKLYRYRLLVAVDDGFRRQALPLPAHAFDAFAHLDDETCGLLLDTARYALDFALGRDVEVRTVLFE